MDAQLRRGIDLCLQAWDSFQLTLKHQPDMRKYAELVDLLTFFFEDYGEKADEEDLADNLFEFILQEFETGIMDESVLETAQLLKRMYSELNKNDETLLNELEKRFPPVEVKEKQPKKEVEMDDDGFITVKRK